MKKQCILLIVEAKLIADKVFIDHEIVHPILMHIAELIKGRHLTMRNKIFLTSHNPFFVTAFEQT